MSATPCSGDVVEVRRAGVVYRVDAADAHRVHDLDLLPAREDLALWVPLDHLGVDVPRRAVVFWPALTSLRLPSGGSASVGTAMLEPRAVGAELRAVVAGGSGCCYARPVLLATANGNRGILTRVHAADANLGLGDLVLREEYDAVPARSGPRELVGHRGRQREMEPLWPRGLLAGRGALHVLWENHDGLGRVWERLSSIGDLSTRVRHACLDVPVFVRDRDPRTARGTALPAGVDELDAGLSNLRYDPSLRGLLGRA